MAGSRVLDDLQQEFGGKLIDVEEKNARRAYVKVEEGDLTDVARYLIGKRARLVIITGIDTRSGIELLYHFFVAGDHHMITLKVTARKPKPTITSLATWLPAANWGEREVRDLLGVTFKEHPDPRRLLLADSWPEGVYPLRRDFKGLPE